MTLRKIVIAGAATLFSLSANSVSAQNKTMNIGPGQPCMPGYSCIIQPPPPPNPGIGVQPACFPPNILVRIQTNFGIRYECRFAQVQPIQPVLPVQPIHDPTSARSI